MKQEAKMFKSNKTRMVIVCSVALFLGIGLAGGAFAADKPVVWRLQSVWATSSAIHGTLANMCKRIKEQSNGQLEAKLFGPGEIVATLEVFDAVSNGVIEMACSSGIYNASKVPEGLVEFGMPFGLENPDQVKEFWYQYKGGEAFKIVQEAYRNRKIELLYIAAGNSYGYMTAFPVNSIADFKGKKIRSFGFFGNVVQAMGAAPVSLPTEDQYLALQQGTVDGTIFPYLAMETMKFKEVTKHIVMPPILGSPTSDIYVSGKAWNQISPDVQKIVREAARLQSEEYLATEYVQEQELLANPDKHGIQIHQLPAADVAQLKAIGGKIWDGSAQKAPGNAKVIDMLKAYKAEKAAK
jgi:TRAP-type transport system periplasmic protein